MTDRLWQQAEVLHAEQHPGTFVPSLDSCAEHDVEDYLTLAREVNVEPAWPQGHGTGQFAPIVDPVPRLMSQWAAVPGDIAEMSHSYEPLLMECADDALERLQQVAAKEGKRLRRPVMCRVIVEAWVEDDQ